MKNRLLLLTMLILLVVANVNLIPKIVWTYADHVEGMTALQQLCINNIKKYAQQTNYTFQFITKQNYTTFFNDQLEAAIITESSQLSLDITIASLIQLKILEEYGGVWIDSTIMLVQTLQWLDTLKNQQFVNNRIDNPEVVIFYEPSWLDETHKRTQLKQEQLVVAPYYQTYFMVAAKEAKFIKTLKALFNETVIASYEKTKQLMQAKGIKMANYLIDQNEFLPWLTRVAVLIHQQQLDQQKLDNRRLAINDFKISAIDSTETAAIIDEKALGFVHMTSKYLADTTAQELNKKFHYLIKIENSVGHQLLEIFEPDYINLEHFHTFVSLVCDDQAIPFRYILKNSVLHRYLLSNTTHQIPVFDKEYINQHCEASYFEVYLFFGKRLLVIVLFLFNIYAAWKAILVFKPQWSKSKGKTVLFEQFDY